MKSDKIKILYITGWGRSGSTILSMLLGQLDGFFLTGEMYQLWQSGFIDNERKLRAAYGLDGGRVGVSRFRRPRGHRGGPQQGAAREAETVAAT